MGHRENTQGCLRRYKLLGCEECVPAPEAAGDSFDCEIEQNKCKISVLSKEVGVQVKVRYVR